MENGEEVEDEISNGYYESVLTNSKGQKDDGYEERIKKKKKGKKKKKKGDNDENEEDPKEKRW